MTPPRPSITEARSSAQHVRSEFIGLTYLLPEGAPQRVLGLWNTADGALRDFILALQELER